jgi:hypothetical protein
MKNNPASKMMGASIVILLLGACSAASAPTATEEENTGETSQALTYHLGYCAIDANDNLTGYCKFPNGCGGGGNCRTASSSSCVVGTHVTDPYTIPCNTCPVKITQVSQNTRCTMYF